jgi:ElaB/YqjD/DUF883 family membrane-anchored ribosome-binding protein
MSDKIEISEIRKAIENLTERLNDQAHAVGDKIRSSTKTGKEKISNIRECVEENPLLSIGIALATGWFVGRLLKRKNKD